MISHRALIHSPPPSQVSSKYAFLHFLIKIAFPSFSANPHWCCFLSIFYKPVRESNKIWIQIKSKGSFFTTQLFQSTRSSNTGRHDIYMIFIWNFTQPDFQGKNITHWIGLHCNLFSITGCYRLLQNITEYYRILQSIAEYCRVLQSITEYYRVLQNIAEYCRVLQSITENYRAL